MSDTADEALLRAIRTRKPVQVAAALSRDANPNSSINDPYPLLHLAATLGLVEIITMLVHAGANVHATDDDRRTALHEAVRGMAESDVSNIMDKLVGAGAVVNAKDRLGYTALDWALCVDKEAAVKLLFKLGGTCMKSRQAKLRRIVGHMPESDLGRS